MKYYKTDSRKISFREYWHIARKNFWLAWLNKIRGVQMNFIRGIPEPQPFKNRIIEARSIPKEILEQLNSGVLDFQKLGFNQFWYFSNSLSLTGGGGYAVEGLHSTGQILGKVLYVYYKGRERLVIAFMTGFTEETILATNNKKREFNPPAGHIVQRSVGAGAEVLFRLHQKKLAELGRAKTSQVFMGLDGVAAFEDKLAQRSYDDKIKRGIWVEMTDAEVAALRAEPARAHLVLPN
jgi:hypothetical protein